MAKELAKQLRLRDLGGLIVVDFIDMNEEKHRAEVERQLRVALKEDKARIRIGRVSNFGMLEMSRQRLRRSLISLRTSPCPRCAGRGRIIDPVHRATHALQLLENVHERREVTLEVDPDTALLLMNQHRSWLMQLEQSRGVRVQIALATAAEVQPRVRDEKMRKDEPPRREREPEATEEGMPAPRRSEPPPQAGPADIQRADSPTPGPDGQGQSRSSRRRRRRRRPVSLPILEEGQPESESMRDVPLEQERAPDRAAEHTAERVPEPKEAGAVRGILKRILPRRRPGQTKPDHA